MPAHAASVGSTGGSVNGAATLPTMVGVHDIVIVRTDPKDALWLESRVEDLVQLLAGTLSHLRADCTDVGPGTREVVFTEDLAATVRSLGSQVVDYEGLQEFDVSRLGGVVEDNLFVSVERSGVPKNLPPTRDLCERRPQAVQRRYGRLPSLPR
jgi:hypothetical protein